MEQRIEPMAGDTSSARLQLAELAMSARSTNARTATEVPNDQHAQAQQGAAAATDTWERGPSERPPAFPPMVHMRARIAAAMNVDTPAQSGMDLLESAASTTQELSKILSKLTVLVGTDGASSKQLERMRVQVQQLLNEMRFQQGPSLDGSTLGDALRADLEVDASKGAPTVSEAA